jgi:hypothetical protein
MLSELKLVAKVHIRIWIRSRHNVFLVQGRCGVCGDEYSAAVKPHEAGGM